MPTTTTPDKPLRQRPWRLLARNRKQLLWVVPALVALAVVSSILFSLARTGNPPDWTGFGPVVISPQNGHVSVMSINQPAKTLWDWMQLLAALLIPVVVAYAGLSFTRQQSRTERQIADDRLIEERRIAENRQREAALETYFARVSQLVLDKGTRGLKHEPDVQAVARAWTVTTLRRLDAQRNAYLLRFLRESQLMDTHDAPIDLGDADLSGIDLAGVDLSKAYLHGASLSGANLHEAGLHGADLSSADLNAADLTAAHLTGAQLVEAQLIGATLTGAYLREANLSEANLREASLHEANLISADLGGANLRAVDLAGANLVGANLSGAFLRGADLRGADLQGANLQGADLQGTMLQGTHLQGANLTRAIVSDEQLAQAASYHGAIMRGGAPDDDQARVDTSPR